MDAEERKMFEIISKKLDCVLGYINIVALNQHDPETAVEATELAELKKNSIRAVEEMIYELKED